MIANHRRATAAAGALAALACIAAPAASASTFAAAATAQFSLVSVTGASLAGLTILGSDTTDQSTLRTGFADSTGDAFVGYVADPLGIGTGFDLLLEAFADGTASDIPVTNSIQRSAVATGVIDIFNGSASDIEITFQVDYTLDAANFAVADPLLVNDGFAEATFALNIDGSSDTFDGVFSDLVLGPTDDSFTGSLLRSFSLAPGQGLLLDLTASAFGFAEVTVVPLPAAAWLLLSAIGGLAATRRLAA